MKNSLLLSIVISTLISAGCISRSKQAQLSQAPPAKAQAHQQPDPVPQQVAQQTTQQVSQPGSASSKEASQSSAGQAAREDVMQVTMRPAYLNTTGKAEDANSTLKIQSQTTATTHQSDAVEPAVALKWLKNGNTRFVKGWLRNDGQSKKDIERLSTGQKPHSIIVSCSDSHVPPEIIFDQKLGEIFVIRTAGEALDPNSIGSIEYAVEHLGVRNIVVMGHTECGAVKAACSTLGGQDAGSENLNKLVADIHPRIKSFKGRLPSKGYEEEAWANVKGIVSDLQKRSQILNSQSQDGKVQISGALYHVDNGNVEFQ